MITATRRFDFHAGHRLPDHDGKCRRLHGHSYCVEVVVQGEPRADGPQTGMVMDFGRLDSTMHSLFELWDHRTLLWENDPLVDAVKAVDPDSVIVLPYVPTAENLAAHVAYDAMMVIDPHVTVTEVRVQETAKGWATWTANS